MENNSIMAIVTLLKDIRVKMEKQVRCCFKDDQITYSQLSVLVILKQFGAMKISQLSEKLGLADSTTSGIVDRMEKLNWVKRIRSEQDRRVVHVVLSDKMDDFTEVMENRMEHFYIDLFSHCTEEDLEDITRGLDKFHDVLCKMEFMEHQK